MSGYTKLFSSIIHSTIWDEENHVRLVWVTMLAMADRDGVVEASLPGLAHAARVSRSDCEAALLKLASPDPYSRSKDHDGRRVAELRGGWQLLNHGHYRELMSAADQREKTAIRVQKHRDVKRRSDAEPVTPGNAEPLHVTPGNGCNDKQKQKQIQKAEADQIPPNPPAGDGGGPSDAPEASEKGAPAKDAEQLTKVFDFWRKEFAHPQAKFDRKRRAKIRDRLREGFTVRELCFAIRGAKKDEFLMGKNDRAMVYDDVTVLLRDAGKVEALMALLGKHRGGAAAGSEPTAQEKALQAAEARRVAELTSKAMAELGDAITGQPGALASARPPTLAELTAGIGG